MPQVLLEVCVDSADGLLSAIRGGADRIELCSALDLGGLTPSNGLISLASSLSASIPVYAMIRPRSGDFIYSEAEVRTMELDIESVAKAGLAGIVYGANNLDGTLDKVILARLMDKAKNLGLGSTLHRSFDLVPELGGAIQTAVELGFERILTSGRTLQAIPYGLPDIAKSVTLASDRISIMPGAGIRPEIVGKMFEIIPGIREVHSSCSTDENVPEYRAKKLAKLGFTRKDEKTRKRTNEGEVRRMKAKLKEFF